MGFAFGVTEPGVECVIDRQAAREGRRIVAAGERRYAERHREQSRRLGREIGPAGIGAADDQRERPQRRLVEAELIEQRIERATLAAMGEIDALDVVGDAANLLRDVLHEFRLDE